MAEAYDITYDGTPVGKAQMEKQGLYYSFSCRCCLPEEGLYRIHVRMADKREDLGICVPMGDTFGMDKKLSAKKLGEGTPAFELVPKDWKPQPVIAEPEPVPEEIVSEDKTIPAEEVMQEEEMMPPEAPEETEPASFKPKEEILPPTVEEEMFIPVSEEEPFDYLDKLEDAHMEIRNDIPGIIIQE